jgi:hypothetical protein
MIVQFFPLVDICAKTSAGRNVQADKKIITRMQCLFAAYRGVCSQAFSGMKIAKENISVLIARLMASG